MTKILKVVKFLVGIIINLCIICFFLGKNLCKEFIAMVKSVAIKTHQDVQKFLSENNIHTPIQYIQRITIMRRFASAE